jgi:uncharacterized Zn-binding protein involved in type VI secretion
MPSVQRVGDANSAGGVATGGVASVRINGRPVIVPGNAVTPHPPCGRKGGAPHCSAVTAGGVGSVKVNGQPIVVTGDVDTCGHPRAGGSADVKVGG